MVINRPVMTPKRFLRIGGVVLITTGVLGVTRLLGRMSNAAFFHPPMWINWVHLVFGLVVYVVASSRWARLQTGMTLGATFIGIGIGSAGLLLGKRAARRFDIPELADPSDHAAHLLVGLTAAWGWLGRAAD